MIFTMIPRMIIKPWHYVTTINSLVVYHSIKSWYDTTASEPPPYYTAVTLSGIDTQATCEIYPWLYTSGLDIKTQHNSLYQKEIQWFLFLPDAILHAEKFNDKNEKKNKIAVTHTVSTNKIRKENGKLWWLQTCTHKTVKSAWKQLL